MKPLVSLFDFVLFRKVRQAFGGELRFFVGGGALLDSELHAFFYAIGIPMYQGYGLSEATPVISTNLAQAALAPVRFVWQDTDTVGIEDYRRCEGTNCGTAKRAKLSSEAKTLWPVIGRIPRLRTKRYATVGCIRAIWGMFRMTNFCMCWGDSKVC